MENIPLVSVIIPNYNYARFLEKRIESVLLQTCTDFEIILLDDASTDNSVFILNKYQTNAHVSYVDINSVNTGSPFAQWQKGIALSRGKYIWIAESDDLASPSFLEKAVCVLERYSQASYCFVGSYSIDESGEQLSIDFDRWTAKQKKCSDNLGVFAGKDYIMHNLYWANYIYNASGVVFRKKCFERITDYSCFSMRYCGDWLFWIEMALQGDVVEIYEKLNYFRQHKCSTTMKSIITGDGLKEDISVIRSIENMLPSISSWRKILRRGIFYKKIRRLKADSKVKNELYQELNTLLDGGFVDFYMERLNKNLSFLIPCLLTRDRDRL